MRSTLTEETGRGERRVEIDRRRRPSSSSVATRMTVPSTQLATQTCLPVGSIAMPVGSEPTATSAPFFGVPREVVDADELLVLARDDEGRCRRSDG